MKVRYIILPISYDFTKKHFHIMFLEWANIGTMLIRLEHSFSVKN